jgi:glycosyltransferase involved in cell wall biosynthesis/SAM-dependent methyltransferase
MLDFTGERIVPGAANCEPRFAEKMYHEHLARYAFSSQWVKGKRVLDVGCGVGYGSQCLAKNGAARVLAFDISAEAISHAKQFYSHANVEFRIASATDFDFGERFDVVTCLELIEHVDDQKAVISCIRRALGDDGILVISTPRALENKRSRFHTREFSEDEFRSFILNEFKAVKFYVENNHFASLVTDGAPKRINRVLPLFDQYNLATADYLIAVASVSDRPDPVAAGMPLIVIGDDRYVTQLERQRGELEAALKGAERQRGELEAALQEAERQRGELEAALRDTSQRLTSVTAELAVREADVADILANEELRFAVLARHFGERQQEYARQLRVQHARQREMRKEHSRQQRELREEHARQQRELQEEHARQQRELEAVLNATRGTLAAMTASASWRITRPARAILARLAFLRDRAARRTDPPIEAIHGCVSQIDSTDDTSPESAEVYISPPLFDREYYLEHNQDVKSAGIDPFQHFVEFGWKEMRNPNELFDVSWYLEQNAAVKQAGINPLEHYIEHGWQEYRDPGPGFSVAFYLSQYQDVRDAGVEPLQHYLSSGKSEGRLPRHPLFDREYYLEHNQDVKSAGIDPFQHFVEFGWKEMRNPNELFDVSWYLEQNAAVKQAGINPLEHYIEHGWQEYRDPGPGFSVAFYLSQYQDVRDAGVEPLQHYRSSGKSEGRLPRAAEVVPAMRFLDHAKPQRVLFVSGDSASPSHTYRIDNMMRGLRALGCQTETVPLHEFSRAVDRMADFHVVVFWRIAIGPKFAWSADVERAIRDCEYHGVAVFFDVDDLVFDQEICTAQYVDGLRYLKGEELAQYEDGVRGYRNLMLRCGNVLVPTDALKQQAEKFGVRAFVVPNGLDDAYQDALAWPVVPAERKTIIVGYTPGTRTHQKDFATAASALVKLLQARPHVQLRILGPLDLSDFPALKVLVGRQVFVNNAVGRAKVFRFNQQIDINTAPLQLNNPYTAAKSELKYFEAAAFGVPTVASRVGPYGRLRNGENGYAVESEDEWLTALTSLVDDSALRQRIGTAARADVKERYTATAIARTMMSAFERLREDLRAKARGEAGWKPAPIKEVWLDTRAYHAERPLVINWLVPGLIIGGGGHRTIMRAAYHLSRFGHRVRLYFTDTDLRSWELRELVRKHFYPMDCPMYAYQGTMAPADVVFATYWKTVEIALQHRDVCPNAFYFVQDFEPFFFPMGSDYILAENTYRQGLYAISAGPWCAHILRTQFNAAVDSFVFPIENVYHPRRRQKENLNILFFCKPEMPRRCFNLGIEMLKDLHALRPDVEIITFGSRHLARESLPFPVTCKGLLPTVDDLAEMYSNADLGIAFSPTNPSLVPYEMMACGLPVVDIARPAAEENYGGSRDIVLLANPLPSEMAREIVALLDDRAERARRASAGRTFVAQFPDEAGMARRIESLIVERLRAVGYTLVHRDDDGTSSHEYGGDSELGAIALHQRDDINRCR